MHSFTNSIPILVLLGVSAIATPIIYPATVDCVIQTTAYPHACFTLARFYKGEETCPASMGEEVFGELLEGCCDKQRHTGTGRVTGDDDASLSAKNAAALSASSAPGTVGVSSDDRNDLLRGLLPPSRNLEGSGNNDDIINVKANVYPAVNGESTESQASRSSSNRRLDFGPHAVHEDADGQVNPEEIVGNNRLPGKGDTGNSRNVSTDRLRLSGSVSESGHDGLTDADSRAEGKQAGLPEAEVEKHVCNVNAAASARNN